MITPAQFAVFVSNINTAIGAVYADQLSRVWQQYATEVPVSGAQFVFGWTGMMPKARVWFGPRITAEPAAQTYTAVPRPYELTFDIDRFDLDDDLFGIYYRMLPDMARQIGRWPEYELRDLLENSGAYTGTAQNGFDGLPYFNTAHPINFFNAGYGTYVNDFSGGGQNVTYPAVNTGGTRTVLVGGAFSPTSFATLYEYQSTLKGEDGERLGVQPSFLMHPVQLKTEVELVLKSMFFAPPAWGTITGQVGAADNPLRRFGIMPIENVFLTDSAMWYMGDGTKAFKGVTWALREAFRIVPRMNENDPVVFDEHKFLIGGWGRATAAWGFSWLMARSGP
jgi:phage major head subunit gpT-like protein